ncbi:hypothetical protein [Pseudarthrobacter sp. N5]|uniref:hypothetical protein n=1 Tax=Pseudarthrobacter sp. N5 TaxID=3418416 RepID=UPI003CEA2F6B
MTRPGPDSPDQSANQDDAVWLDLVSRLEADSPTDATSTDAGPEAIPGLAHGDGGGAGQVIPGHPDAPGVSRFMDFDPLGLSHAAPTELSAGQRQAAAEPAAATDPSSGRDGPRDYGVEDDDGAFVPEEPPSLSGTDPLTMLAWLGAGGGPVALVLSAMFWRSAPLMAILGIVTAFVASVIYLIMKLPQEKDENDDGARV